MSATKTDVLTLVSLFSLGKADQTACSQFFDEEIITLGHDPRNWLANYAQTASGTRVSAADLLRYQTPTTVSVVEILALFIGDRQLQKADIVELEARSKAWRDRSGAPVVFVVEREDDRTLRLYPSLDRTYTVSDAGRPLVVHTEHKTTGLPAILELPLALLVLAREYERESNHRDTGFADIARALAQHILTLVF